MVEVLDYSQLYTEDIAFGVGAKELRLQNGELTTLQHFDPGWELAYRTGELQQYLGKRRAVLISRPTIIDRPLTIPAGDTLLFTRGGSLTLNADVTCNGTIEAGHYQIFFGTKKITFTKQPTIYPEWWGADDTGVLDAKPAFDLAIASLVNGGTLVGGGVNATYNFVTALANITKSNVHMDMQYAMCRSTGTAYFNMVSFNGDIHIDGDRSGVVKNCSFRNARIGLANDDANRMAPPEFRWTDNCLMENITCLGKNSGLNVSTSHHATVRNLHLIGLKPGQIYVIAHMSNWSLYDNIYMDSEGNAEAICGLQLKGGVGNVVQNCTVRNNLWPGFTHRFMFFISGDSPWDIADSSIGLTYPFTGGLTWTDQDERRACLDNKIINCHVIDCPTCEAFRVNSQLGTMVTNCTAENVRTGFRSTRQNLTNARDRNVQVIGCTFRRVGVVEGSGESGAGIEFTSDHTTKYTGIFISNCMVRDTTAAGIYLRNTSGASVDNCQVFDAGQALIDGFQDGILVAESNYPRVISCIASDTRSGSSRTQASGVSISPSNQWPAVTNCYAINNLTFQMKFRALGYYSQNHPGDGWVTTQDATADNTSIRFGFPDNQIAWINVKAIGRQGTTQAAYYTLSGLFNCVAGVVTMIAGPFTTTMNMSPTTALLTDNSGGTADNTIASITTGGAAADQTPTRNAIADLAAKVNTLVTATKPIETVPAWVGPEFFTGGVDLDTVYLLITGAAATTIHWTVWADCVIAE